MIKKGFYLITLFFLTLEKAFSHDLFIGDSRVDFEGEATKNVRISLKKTVFKNVSGLTLIFSDHKIDLRYGAEDFHKNWNDYYDIVIGRKKELRGSYLEFYGRHIRLHKENIICDYSTLRAQNDIDIVSKERIFCRGTIAKASQNIILKAPKYHLDAFFAKAKNVMFINSESSSWLMGIKVSTPTFHERPFHFGFEGRLDFAALSDESVENDFTVAGARTIELLLKNPDFIESPP